MSASAERARLWRERNPGRGAAYRAAHAAEISAADALYRVSHREERRAAGRAYYDANREGLLTKAAAHLKTPAGRAKQIRAAAIERAKRPQAASARAAVGHALRRGDLVRQTCAVCGADPARAHHHLGYEREHWLDVQWLCDLHHAQAHKVEEV